ncbi:MAG: TauD/TfdA dioxygenase family protein, partial [Lautropia sp.]
MALKVYPIGNEFAAEVGDIDLSRPLSAQDEAQIKSAFARYAVLVFPQQELTPEQHVALARRFGELEISKQLTRRTAGALRIREDLADTSNLDQNGQPFAQDSRQRFDRLANMLWHSDSSFKHVPAYASLLYARSVAPIGGHTEFADMRAAWEALPLSTRQRNDGLRVEHWYLHSRAKMGCTELLPDELSKVPPV